jgi:S1-C subfamily serine protease
VRAIAPSTAAIDEGAPVAMLGYPLGLDLQMGGDWREVGVSATSMQGTVSRVLPTLVQVDGYGAQGSSGSPIFNARGEVVAVLYGSERDSAGRIIYGVPVRFVHELLRDAPRLK